MKNLILTLAAAILICTFSTFQSDSFLLVWTMNNMKLLCDEIARSSALSIEMEALSEGIISFDIEEGDLQGHKAFNRGLRDLKGRSNTFIFNDSKIQYYITFVSQDAIITYNSMGNVVKRKPFEETFTLECRDETITVRPGMVIAEICCGRANYSLSFLRNTKELTTYSVYEYVLPY